MAMTMSIEGEGEITTSGDVSTTMTIAMTQGEISLHRF
jgi:formylmethanofuran dehydrogenase subunit C